MITRVVFHSGIVQNKVSACFSGRLSPWCSKKTTEWECMLKVKTLTKDNFEETQTGFAGIGNAVNHTGKKQVNVKHTKSQRPNHVFVCFHMVFFVVLHTCTNCTFDGLTNHVQPKLFFFRVLHPWQPKTKNISGEGCAQGPTGLGWFQSVICWCMLAVVFVPSRTKDWWGGLLGLMRRIAWIRCGFTTVVSRCFKWLKAKMSCGYL